MGKQSRSVELVLLHLLRKGCGTMSFILKRLTTTVKIGEFPRYEYQYVSSYPFHVDTTKDKSEAYIFDDDDNVNFLLDVFIKEFIYD